MDTFTKGHMAPSVPPEMSGTLLTARWRERGSFGADYPEDRHVISAEDWRAWEEKTRLRGKARVRKIIVTASLALLFLSLIFMAKGVTLPGVIRTLLLVVAVTLVIHVLRSRRSIL